MPAPTNSFKAALGARQQIGLWLALTSPDVAELCAGAGFDWVVIDGEHSAWDMPSILGQVRAVAAAGAGAHPIVRIPEARVWMIKQVLDIGVQTILVPMVESAEQAREMVRAMRYPPEGVRGVGATLARASGYGAVPDYVTSANAETCLIVQVESRAGVAALDEILGVEEVDAVFIGPADLAADMGYPGRYGVPEVQAVIEDCHARIAAAGKAAGVLTFDPEQGRRYLEAGVAFVGVGADAQLLAAAARRLSATMR